MKARIESPVEPRYISINNLMTMFGVGRNTALKLGKAAGAEKRIGKRIIYDVKAIESYVNECTTSTTEEPNEEKPVKAASPVIETAVTPDSISKAVKEIDRVAKKLEPSKADLIEEIRLLRQAVLQVAKQISYICVPIQKGDQT